MLRPDWTPSTMAWQGGHSACGEKTSEGIRREIPGQVRRVITIVMWIRTRLKSHYRSARFAFEHAGSDGSSRCKSFSPTG